LHASKPIKADAGFADTLREYLHGDFLMLYSIADDLATVRLLTIHHY